MTINNSLRICFAILLIAPFAGYADTPIDSDVHIRSLAASCAACHGTNGNTIHPAGGKAPEGKATLAGMDRQNFIKQLTAFKSGERKSTVMHHHAKGLSSDEIEQLANFFAAQKPQAPYPLNHQILGANHD